MQREIKVYSPVVYKVRPSLKTVGSLQRVYILLQSYGMYWQRAECSSKIQSVNTIYGARGSASECTRRVQTHRECCRVLWKRIVLSGSLGKV